MPIRKGRLFKPCKNCGEMYEPHTKCKGLCKKCKPPTFLDKLAEISAKQTHTIILSKDKKKK